MKTLGLLSIGVVVAGLASAVHAQGGPQRGGLYDPATETTVKGTVGDVKTLPSSGRGGGGLHLVLVGGDGPVEIDVGPASFVSSKNVAFAKGDVLTVVGSKIAREGAEVVIAREITKGDRVLTLRDANGLPLWSARGRGR
jgi:DNA/RNA endonuclease YhcR with UshA esterase domain